MSDEAFAPIWPFLVAVFVVATAFAINWFEDRAERRKRVDPSPRADCAP